MVEPGYFLKDVYLASSNQLHQSKASSISRIPRFMALESEFALNFNAKKIAVRKLRNREIVCQMAYIFTHLNV